MGSTGGSPFCVSLGSWLFIALQMTRLMAQRWVAFDVRQCEPCGNQVSISTRLRPACLPR